jgi:tetratricopeptide (TPR) repeat protein
MEALKKITLSFSIVMASLITLNAQDAKQQEAFTTSYTLEYNGDYQKAIDAIKKVYDEKSYELNLRAGWLNYEAALYIESQQFYQKAISLNPNSIEAKLGYIYPATALGNKDQVINQYSEILKIDTQNATANYQLGLYYYYKKDYKKGINYFEKLVTLSPSGYDALLMYAWTEFQLGKTIEAYQLFNKVLLISPNDKSALEGLALIK